MDSFENDLFDNGKFIEASLLEFGFRKEGSSFRYEENLLDGMFLCGVTIDDAGVRTTLIDNDTNEPYELYRMENVIGPFANKAKEAVKELLNRIGEKCFVEEDWTNTIPGVIQHFKDKYGENIEYPWDTNNAIIRRRDNRKWYALFMPIPISKLGLRDERTALVLNIKGDISLIDNESIFVAFHMNKKHWLSILVERLDEKTLVELIEESRNKAKGK